MSSFQWPRASLRPLQPSRRWTGAPASHSRPGHGSIGSRPFDPSDDVDLAEVISLVVDHAHEDRLAGVELGRAAGLLAATETSERVDGPPVETALDDLPGRFQAQTSSSIVRGCERSSSQPACRRGMASARRPARRTRRTARTRAARPCARRLPRSATVGSRRHAARELGAPGPPGRDAEGPRSSAGCSRPSRVERPDAVAARWSRAGDVLAAVDPDHLAGNEAGALAASATIVRVASTAARVSSGGVWKTPNPTAGISTLLFRMSDAMWSSVAVDLGS